MQLRPVAPDDEVADTVGQALRRAVTPVGVLDVDVHRLNGDAGGPDIVARAFGPDVDRSRVDTVATVLSSLAGTRFPAERCLGDDPVLPLGAGRHLLLTEYVEPTPAPGPSFLVAWCVGLLARLSSRSGENLPVGGGWHRLGATPADEIGTALELGAGLGSELAEVVDTLADADDGAGLPEALIHPDLVPPNAVPRGDQPPVIVDWIGVGRGPRTWPLAYLLFVAGPRAARRVMDRYTAVIALSEEERQRLAGVMIARPLALDLWSVAYERMTVERALARCRSHRRRADSVAAALRDDSPAG